MEKEVSYIENISYIQLINLRLKIKRSDEIR